MRFPILSVSLFALSVFGRPSKSERSVHSPSPRSGLCGDTSLAKTIYSGFNGASTIHLLSGHYLFVVSNTLKEQSFWTDEHPVFRGWTGAQSGIAAIVPFWQLANADRTEYIYQMGVSATVPPVVTGFTTDAVVVSWVYNAAVCGSVPLLSAALSSRSDHYYTTDVDELNGLVANGWTNNGIVAYVLPL